MKKVIFVRHAETSDNQGGYLHGNGPVEFTKQGIANLHKLKIVLNKYAIDIALVSDMGRCVETARYILCNRTDLISLTPLVREKSNGSFAGQKIDSIDWDQLEGSFENRKPPGGESLADLRQRVRMFIRQLTTMDYESILVVSHGAFLKVLFGELMGKNLRQSIFELHVDHCSLTTAKFDARGKLKLLNLNSVSHL